MESNETGLQDFEIQALNEENSKLLEQLVRTQANNDLLSRQLLELENEVLSLEQEVIELSELDKTRPFERIFNHLPLPIFVIDSHGLIAYHNRAAESFFELESSETVSVNFKRLLNKESARVFTKALIELRKNNFDQELVVASTSGRRFNPRFSSIDLDSETNQLFFTLLALPVDFSDDSTQLMRLYMLAIDQIKDGVMITDGNQNIIKVNQAFIEITGYKAEEVVGKTPNVLSSGRHSADFYQKIWHQIASHGWWEGEIWNKNKGGQVYPEWLQINRIWDSYSKQKFYIAIFSDITGRKSEQNKLDRLAFFDTLTGLPNRESLRNYLENLVQRSALTENRFATLFVDLDKFKEVNDRFGHAEGDLVLQLATQRIISSVRDSDYAARVGGDEFVIVLNRIKDQQGLSGVVKTLLEKLSAPYNVREHTHFLSASIGISFFPEHAAEYDELLRKADLAMYQAKEYGRNQYRIFEVDYDQRSVALQEMKEFIRHCIENFAEFIEIHYQPIVLQEPSESSREFECLVRLKKEGELIFPDQFIEISEHHGLIQELGFALFEKVCSDIRHYQRFADRFAVNLSPLQFDNANLVADLKAIAETYEVRFDQFKFEVTETALTQNVLLMEHTLGELREDNIEILLDDFGTGYASLSMLNVLPVDTIKIDRSFIQDSKIQQTQELVKAMIYMAKALNLKVVCEGVETLEQYQWLQSLEVDYYQGYYFSKPLPLKRFFEDE